MGNRIETLKTTLVNRGNKYTLYVLKLQCRRHLTIMLLSDWYSKWKENRIQRAVEEAKAKAYEEGYAAGKSRPPDLKGITVIREAVSGYVLSW